MYKRKPKSIIALLLILCLIASLLPGVPMRSEAAEAEPQAAEEELHSFQLDADCKILNYVHEDVFTSANHVARLTEAETPSSYVFLNEDGTTTVYYMAEAVKFVDANGITQEKDLTLMDTVGGYTTTKNDFGLTISQNPANGVSLVWNNKSVRLIPQGGTAGETVVENNAVRYVDYYGAGMDLVYTPTLTGVKEDIVLESYTGKNTFTFMLNTGGLNLYSANGRYFLAASKTEKDRIELGEVVTFDARGRFSVGTMTAQTVKPGQIYQLTLTVDEAFLTDPNTTYPVSVDPQLTISDNTHGANAIEDVSVYLNKPTTNGNWTYLHSGYYDSTYGVARTLFRLNDLIDSVYLDPDSGYTVNSAEFHIWEASGTQSTDMYLYANWGSANWAEATVTWSSANMILGDRYGNIPIGVNAEAVFNITNLVQAWRSGREDPQAGFILKSSNETSVDKAFYSSEYGTTGRRPYVVLNYTTTIQLSKYIATANENTNFTIRANKTVTWSSSNTAIASVSSSGVVTCKKAGQATITATDSDGNTATCAVFVVIPEGVYYIQNASTEYYLDGGGLNITPGNLTNVKVKSLASIANEKLPQMWKVKHLSGGLYSIRPMHKLDMGLSAPSSDVRLTEIGTTDSLSGIATNSRWKIYYSGSGYVLQCEGSAARTLAPFSNVTIVDALVSALAYSSTTAVQHWTFTRIDSPPSGVLFYDKVTGKAVTSRKFVAEGQTKKFKDLGLDVAVYSANSLVQTVTWVSSTPTYVRVNQDSGDITGVSASHYTTIQAICTDGSASGSYVVECKDASYFGFRHYFDADTFGYDTTDALVNHIPQAVRFADEAYYRMFGVMFHSSINPTVDNISGVHECDANGACSNGSGCGTDCEEDHHKNTTRVAGELYSNDSRARNDITVLWSNYAADTYCHYYAMDHQTRNELALVVNNWPIIHIMRLLGNNENQLEACMAINLAHETMHCFNYLDTEGYDNPEHVDVAASAGAWGCVMEEYEGTHHGLTYDYYVGVLRGEKEAFCELCQEQIANRISIENLDDDRLE